MYDEYDDEYRVKLTFILETDDIGSLKPKKPRMYNT